MRIKIKDFKKLPLSILKYTKFSNNSSLGTYIYGNTVALVLLNEQSTILIKQKEIADGFRNNFNSLWETAKS